MEQDASFVNHSKVQRSPVLKEREVYELVVDGEVVVGRAIVRGHLARAMVIAAAHLRPLKRLVVEQLRIRRRMREGREIEPTDDANVF